MVYRQVAMLMGLSSGSLLQQHESPLGNTAQSAVNVFASQFCFAFHNRVPRTIRSIEDLSILFQANSLSFARPHANVPDFIPSAVYINHDQMPLHKGSQGTISRSPRTYSTPNHIVALRPIRPINEAKHCTRIIRKNVHRLGHPHHLPPLPDSPVYSARVPARVRRGHGNRPRRQRLRRHPGLLCRGPRTRDPH